MRPALALFALAMASGALLASDPQDDFHWIQVQGGITDHRTKNFDHQQPAAGFGVGDWINGHWGLEVSGLITRVNYGYGISKEAHMAGSVLINPFHTPQTLRPFLRLGVGAAMVGTPLSGTSTRTTRLSGVVGLGVQALLGDQLLFTLEGRLVQIESQISRKEGQALAGIGVRWGNRRPAPPAAPLPVPPPPLAAPEPPPPPPPVVAAPEPPVVLAPAPEAAPPKVILDEATLHFANDRAELSPEGEAAVVQVAAELKEIKAPYQVVATGHASKVGTAAHNLKLSRRRAHVVAKVLTTAGIPAEAIQTEGVGFTQPRVEEVTKADQAQNRRVEISIKTKADNAETRPKATPVVE